MDLFPEFSPKAPEAPRMLSVTELTRSVRSALESAVGVVWVEGEVSNFRKQSSGHQYFTLKDAGSQLACVLFARPGMWRKAVTLADGMQVQVRGALTVYEARGQYQLNVQIVQAGGAGLLQAKFEALKQKLDAEGLFAAERKRPLPKFAESVGIVTSPTGAALRDLLNVLARRAPWVRVTISPARVQGAGAAGEIARAIELLNQPPGNGWRGVAVIVVARGGGSAEDLWEFNEEIVARAMVASRVPVVSAVGHETDFSIADFSADLRAATPSAAAELVVPDTAMLLRHIAQLGAKAQRAARESVGRERRHVDFLARSALFREPRSRLSEAAQRSDFAADALQRAARDYLAERRRRVLVLQTVLREHRPDHFLTMRRQELAHVARRVHDAMRARARRNAEAVLRLREKLTLLAPDATLARGYSITLCEDGSVLNSAEDVSVGMKLRTRMHDGEVHSTVDLG